MIEGFFDFPLLLICIFGALVLLLLIIGFIRMYIQMKRMENQILDERILCSGFAIFYFGRIERGLREFEIDPQFRSHVEFLRYANKAAMELIFSGSTGDNYVRYPVSELLSIKIFPVDVLNRLEEMGYGLSSHVIDAKRWENQMGNLCERDKNLDSLIIVMDEIYTCMQNASLKRRGI